MSQRVGMARNLIVQVAAADGLTALAIAEITNTSFNGAENEELTEITSYDSQGDYEGRYMQRGKSITVTAQRTYDDITGAPDPGQARVELMADQVAEDSVGKVRLRQPGGTTWYVWEEALFSLGNAGGGGNNDPNAIEFTITRSGPTTTQAFTTIGQDFPA
jgi:hypothetical protein